MRTFNAGLGWAGLGVILSKLKPNCQGFLDSWYVVGSRQLHLIRMRTAIENQSLRAGITTRR